MRFSTIQKLLMTGLIFMCVFAAGLGALTPGDAWAAKKKKAPANNPLYASIVVDSDTGVILHQSNPDKKLHPASLTKVMTLLMLFEAMDRGQVSLNDSIKISRKAASASPSKLGLSPGSTIRVKDAILALVTKSANDIAVAIAEHLGETEDRFAIAMTGRARELGMNNTTFRNASGLHNPGQISSARDMAIMARYVINRYPDYYRYFKTQNFSYRGQNYHNHNHLMKSYKGMDGMKTGFINPSGFNLVASAVRGNNRLIGVVFGGRSANSRNEHMRELLDAGFKKALSPDLNIASAESRLSVEGLGLPPTTGNAPEPGRKPILSGDSQLAMAPAAPLTQPLPVQGLRESDTVAPNADAMKKIIETRLASLNTQLKKTDFSEMMGQGDYDAEQAKRIETGMMAIAAHTGQSLSAPKGPILRTDSEIGSPVAVASFAPPLRGSDLNAGPGQGAQGWAIQIGAFTSRVATDVAIKKTLGKLPAQYASASPIIVPLRTQEGWLFRGRLSGFETAQAAAQACGYIGKDCVPVSPHE